MMSKLLAWLWVIGGILLLIFIIKTLLKIIYELEKDGRGVLGFFVRRWRRGK